MTAREPVAVVLTALPAEMAAVLGHLGGDRSSVLVGAVLCEVGRFAASGGQSWRVVAAELGPGAIDTAAAVVALAARFGPDVLMFAGVAGALRNDVTIGDVVAGTEVAWTERGKWTRGGYQTRVRTVSLSAPLSQLARKVARESTWRRRLARPRPGAKAVVGQIACGEKVVAGAEYRAWLRATFSDAVAIENEGFALARAGEVHAAGQRCVVRGISGNADGGKSDDGHADAADAAAAFAFELIDVYSAQAYGEQRTEIAGRDPGPRHATGTASSRTPRDDAAGQPHDAGQAASTIKGDGLFLVGLDVKPGVYRTSGPAGTSRDGYIGLLASTSTRDITGNVIVSGPATVMIGPGVKAVDVRACQPWHWIGADLDSVLSGPLSRTP